MNNSSDGSDDEDEKWTFKDFVNLGLLVMLIAEVIYTVWTWDDTCPVLTNVCYPITYAILFFSIFYQRTYLEHVQVKESSLHQVILLILLGINVFGLDVNFENASKSNRCFNKIHVSNFFFLLYVLLAGC